MNGSQPRERPMLKTISFPVALVGLLLGLASCSGDRQLPAALLQEQPTLRAKDFPTNAATQAATVSPTSTTSADAAEATSVLCILEEVGFKCEYFTLVGDLRLPPDAGNHPGIIMAHGDGGSTASIRANIFLSWSAFCVLAM